MEMRVKPLFAGGRRITRPDSATYVGVLQLQEVWVSKTELHKATLLLNHGGHKHEILPRLYLPRLVRILASGILLQGLEDYRSQGERYVVLQQWRSELPEQSEGRFDLDWHPIMARRLRKAGFSLARDL
jgi:hypothetical protein